MPAEPPLPPIDLVYRVGIRRPADPLGDYDALGRDMRADIEELLGEDWSWQGKRVLDFGCGAGRLLRHFTPEAETGAGFLGCDLDRASIEWLREQLVPPLESVFANDPEPPLPLPAGELDLVIAASVFTHLAHDWAEWLLELHRVLRPGGLLVASFLGRGMSDYAAAEPWEEDRIGMNVIVSEEDRWERTNILHSPWWLRAHWGRAFEIIRLREEGFGLAGGKDGQGLLLARRREVTLGPEDLERPEPDEPRELLALRHNVYQQRRQTVWAGEHLDELRSALAAHRGSRSWRLTRPLRALAGATRRLRPGGGGRAEHETDRLG